MRIQNEAELGEDACTRSEGLGGLVVPQGTPVVFITMYTSSVGLGSVLVLDALEADQRERAQASRASRRRSVRRGT